MLKKNPLPEQIIVKNLNTNFGIEITNLIPLFVGADTNSTIYKAQAPDKTKYFIKVKQDYNHDISAEIAKLLYNAKIQQIIPPIKTIHGKTTQSIDNCTLIVYPFIEGHDGFSQKLTDSQWIELGSALRQIHNIKTPASVRKQIRKETYSAKWRMIVSSTCDCVEPYPVNDQIALDLQKFIKKNLKDIHKLVNFSEKLGDKLKKSSLEFVLCHSDIHGGNVLLDKNSHIYIVDWDEPIIAPKERDLMFIGGGVGNVWNNPLEEKLFYKGYGKTEIDKIALAYYRHERIIEDIGTVENWNHFQ